MRVTTRSLQFLGLALLAGCAFRPAYHFTAYPLSGHVPQQAEAAPVGFYIAGTKQVPAYEVGGALLSALRGPDRGHELWGARPWYPFLLAPLWLLALLLAGPPGDPARRRMRRVVDGALLLLAVGVAIFEACYLATDYVSLMSGALGFAEGMAAWLVILGMLFWRRRRSRHLGAVEAAVAGQALLGFVHLLTLPATMARPWVGLFDLGSVARAIWLNYLPPFWVACAGMLLIAMPVYFGVGKKTGPRQHAGEGP